MHGGLFGELYMLYIYYVYIYMGVSKNMGKPPKSSILIGFSIIYHPFWVPLFLETSIYTYSCACFSCRISHKTSSSTSKDQIFGIGDR